MTSEDELVGRLFQTVRDFTMEDEEAKVLTLAVLSAIREAGYAVVPVEPGKEVLVEGAAIPGVSLQTMRSCYRAMIAAAGKET